VDARGGRSSEKQNGARREKSPFPVERKGPSFLLVPRKKKHSCRPIRGGGKKKKAYMELSKEEKGPHPSDLVKRKKTACPCEAQTRRKEKKH